MALKCPHCRQVGAGDAMSRLLCHHCKLYFGFDGLPFVPEVCTRCESPEITWTGYYYDCAACGRVEHGPYPSSPGTRTGPEPAEGWGRYAPGVVPGLVAG
jgi:hypothetical protein